jgi:serine/threonine-protein kinase RsbW
MKSEVFEFTLASNKSEIGRIERKMEEINLKFNLDFERLINFQIALSEALVNAIVHGNKENSEKKVYVKIEYSDTSLTVTIKDEGTGFDVNKLADPTMEENLQKEHGRGIFIIRSLVDKFECNSSGNGTVFILTIYKK